ncbi:hypothetical protein PLANPX_4949 [Lacipirellula parvula]|uniref:Uncharacterized protein n=1 Tax=Lacipirellula parvula TaxID=2650471 RepID=A0A5K7XH68_9BACT|nr:hypothetical protein PLANPX_4949 [Lacipirellula parvula]
MVIAGGEDAPARGGSCLQAISTLPTAHCSLPTARFLS